MANPIAYLVLQCGIDSMGCSGCDVLGVFVTLEEAVAFAKQYHSTLVQAWSGTDAEVVWG